MLSSAITMFLAVALLATYLKPHTRRRLAGYGFYLDVLVWSFVLFVFSGTGSERMAGVGMTIGITAAIHFYRWGWGYERHVLTRGWVRYHGWFTRPNHTEHSR